MDIEIKISDELIHYPEALSYMDKRVMEIINEQNKELIWFLEHKEVYTAGVSATKEELKNPLLPVYNTGRGGKYTYHGPGQRVVYLLFDLKKIFSPKKPDIRNYVYLLEQAIIDCLKEFNIKGERRTGRIGIWVNVGDSEAKIAAIGIRIKKWISYHGIAINLNPNLDNYSGIIPCGISNYGVTSFAKLNVTFDKKKFDDILLKKLQQNLKL